VITITLMHTFSERIPVQDCKKLIHEVDPLDLVEYLRFFLIEKVNSKKGTIEIIYVHNPRARFGGKAKTRVTVTAGENSLRLHGLGPVSFELRLSCITPRTLVVYMTVTGKLIDRIPKQRARELFEALVAELRSRGGAEEALPPAPEAAAPAAGAALAAPVAAGTVAASPAGAPAAASQVPVAAPQPSPPAAVAAPQAAAQPPAGGEVDLAACIVRLITAGFPVDDELSRRVPSEFSPRLRSLPVAAHGYEPSERVNLIMFDDADYLIRLVSGDVRVDVVRLGGRVGVYYRGPEGEAYGDEAARLAAEKLCVPGRRIAYTVARLG